LKKRAKVFIDTTVDNLSTGLGAVLVLLLTGLMGVSYRELSYVSLGLIGVWIFGLWPLRRAYVDAFRQALDRREMRSDDFRIQLADSEVIGSLDGIEFLGQVKKYRPEITRIILTGYADKENAIKAINDVGLFQYIEKPWDNEDLRIIIRNGLEKKLLMKQLQQKIDQINSAYSELQSIQQEVLKTFV
jgi:DNA-binding NtrC family response regulator